MLKVVSSEKKSIKIWASDLEEETLQQAKNLANLPFAFKHIALMGDAHTGYGMPIGGILATKNVIIPNACGSDIGCGMQFTETNIPIDILNTPAKDTTLLKAIMGNIRRVVPVGFNKHQVPQEWSGFDFAPELKIIQENLGNSRLSLGTLGGGNHFIELQKTPYNSVGIMLHSGSRNLGKRVCDYYNKVAQELNAKWYSSVTKDIQLAFLPMDTPEGVDYYMAMEWLLLFAKQNRTLMMERIKNIILNMVGKYTDFKDIVLKDSIDVHHNYIAIENHFGENVMVHRKGATRAREDDFSIIPGSQGTKSYIVRGLGNPDSFMSCSHGAGRAMSRTKARETLSLAQEIKKLDDLGIVHGIRGVQDLDEASSAYKSIDEVMENQKDLVVPIMELSPIGVIKG